MLACIFENLFNIWPHRRRLLSHICFCIQSIVRSYPNTLDLNSQEIKSENGKQYCSISIKMMPRLPRPHFKNHRCVILCCKSAVPNIFGPKDQYF